MDRKNTETWTMNVYVQYNVGWKVSETMGEISDTTL